MGDEPAAGKSDSGTRESSTLSKPSAIPESTTTTQLHERKVLIRFVIVLAIVSFVIALAMCALFLAPSDPEYPHKPPLPLLFDDDEPLDTSRMPPMGKLIYNSQKLPMDIVPLHYDIEIQAPYRRTRYGGMVTVMIECKKATDRIILHAEGDFIFVDISIKGTPTVKSVSITAPYVIVALDKNLEVSKKYELFMAFSKRYPYTPMGFYIDYYTGSEQLTGVTLTAFKPDGARHAFPCFDEPHLKAVFHLTVVRPKNLTAISNTPLLTKSNRGRLVADSFNETPPMSTYSLAWFVSPYRRKMKDEVILWYPESKEDYTDHILDVAVSGLRFFKDLFGTPSTPIAKLEITSSERHTLEAEGSWGLIIFREQTLYQANQTDDTTSLILAQIAHQWLGNLVTVRWWTDIWIDEAVCSYLGVLAAETLYPNQGHLMRFVQTSIIPQSNYDDPMPWIPGRTKRALLEMISTTPTRSLHLVRTLHMIVGDQAFRAGLKAFVINYHGKSATLEDFLHAIDQSGAHIEKIKALVNAGGFPKVTLRRFYNGTAQVTQERYLSNIGTTYAVPIVVQTAVLDVNKPPPATVTWLDKKAEAIHVNVGANSPLIVNPGAMGMNVLSYDNRNWALIGRALSLKPQATDIFNKWKLFQDSVLSYRHRAVSIEAVLWMVRSLTKETEREVWQFAFPHIDDIDKHIVRMEGSIKDAYERELMKTIKKMADQLPFEVSKSVLDYESKMMDFFCALGYQKCKDLASRKWTSLPDTVNSYSSFEKWLNGQTAVTPFIILCMAVRHAGAWNKALSWLHDAKDYDAANLNNALACSQTKAQLKSFLSNNFVDNLNWGIFDIDVTRPATLFGQVVQELFTEKNFYTENRSGKEYAKQLMLLAADYVKTQDELEKVRDKATAVGLKGHLLMPQLRVKKRLDILQADAPGVMRWNGGNLPDVQTY